MAITVSKLAKELGITTDEILEELHKLYMDAEDEKSEVAESIAGLIRHKFGGAVPAPKKKAAKKTTKKKATKTTKKKGEEEKKTTKKKTSKKKAEEEEKKPKKKVAKKEEKVKEEKKAEEKEEKKPKKKELGRINIIKKAEPQEEKPEEKKAAVEEEAVQEETGRKKKDKLADEDARALKAGKKAKKAKPAPKEIWRAETTKVSFRKPGKKKRPSAGAGKQNGNQETVIVSPTQRKVPKKIQVAMPVNVRTLAPLISTKPNAIIQYLMGKGMFANINQDLEEDLVRDIMENFGYELELRQTTLDLEKELVSEHHDNEKAETESRAPIVTFMGHVDHGKTSLLDYIRETHVTKSEKGGITQHIGAYKVEMDKGSVTFLDTPGHEAFTAMRARGANATDVVVLVVAADDGVMPQTKEAIDHSKAAGVPIVVAINKCDLVSANPDKVRIDLQENGLMDEKWGGDIAMVEVSAHTGEGVDDLLELLTLESDLLELKANANLKARGIVVESKKSAGQGVVVTLLVQNGTLKPGDVVLCGSFFGKVKAMINDHGERVTEAPPSTPVEILGLQGVPEAGEEFFVVKDEKKAKTLSELKQNESRKQKMAGSQRVSLEDLHTQILQGGMKELKIILKADVQGSIEALKKSLEDLSTDEVKVNIIHDTVGNVNESDVMLAVVSNAIILGFHVKVDSQADEIAKKEKVDLHLYDIIYEAIAEVKAGMEGLLEPELVEVFQGRAQVLEVFSTSKAGNVAGCSVLKGVIHRKDKIRVKRGDEVVFEGGIHALKRFKDDVKEVREGFECGISISGFNGCKKGDLIEAYIIEKIARRLDAKKK